MRDQFQNHGMKSNKSQNLDPKTWWEPTHTNLNDKIFTPINITASVRASSVCGTCIFISSPSKSALYGLHTDSLNLNVLQGITLACMHITVKCNQIIIEKFLSYNAANSIFNFNHPMTHDGHPMQAWLSVEKNNVPIFQMTVNYISVSQCISKFLSSTRSCQSAAPKSKSHIITLRKII